MDANTALALIVVAGLYMTVCRIWPYTACGKCRGGNRYQPGSHRYWRHCGRCGGSGRKTRLGARLWR